MEWNNGLKLKVRWLLFSHLILHLFVFTGCKSQQKSTATMNAVKILVDFPTMSEKGEVFRVRDSLYVIYYKEYFIYKIGVERSSKSRVFNNEGDMIKETELRNWYDYRYYLRKKDEQTGYYFDSLSAPQYKIVNVDSIIRKKISVRYDAIYKEGDSLAAASARGDSILSETYVRKKPGTNSLADTIYLRFDKKLNNIDFSFQHYLDSTKKMKLVYVKSVNAPDPTRQHPFFELKRENYISMERIEVAEKKEILALIGRINN